MSFSGSSSGFKPSLTYDAHVQIEMKVFQKRSNKNKSSLNYSVLCITCDAWTGKGLKMELRFILKKSSHFNKMLSFAFS